jgi:hypothetical protein
MPASMSSEIGWDTVRDNVGVVLQHPVLFNASVRENLTMGREYADADLWQALEIAQLGLSCRNLIRASTVWWARVACACPAASASAWRWRAWCSENPAW